MKVGVFGAGAIGSHVGVRLSAAGEAVVLLGRPALVELRDALVAVDRRGRTHRPGPDLVVTTDPRALAEVDVCLVTVKSRDTEATARTLRRLLPARTPVVSLQNGLRNVTRLRATLPRVVPGVVGFNVVSPRPGTTTEAVAGRLYLGEPAEPSARAAVEGLADALGRTGMSVDLRRDIDAVAAGKLLLNLNNGIGGATGLGIAQMLADPDARACFSACILEGHRILGAAGIATARVGPLGPRALAAILRLPSWLVSTAGRAMAAIDPNAVPSTLQDLRRGRPTEIGDLNGEIVARAHALGRRAPYNETVVDAVRAHEATIARGDTPRWLPAAELWARMRTPERSSRSGVRPSPLTHDRSTP